MNLQKSIRRVLREESNIKTTLNELLNLLFDGFDDIYYDWAEFNCGMGVCCDPYAIGFVLPENDYNDYLFKLVDDSKYDVYGDYPKSITDELPEVCYNAPNLKDPNFNKIVFYQDFADEINGFIGSEKNWVFIFIDIINEKFGCEATGIVIV